MSTPEIVQDGHPALRTDARAVSLDEISSPQIQACIEQMKAALEKEQYGVAIAAPQIGESLRMFVVAGHVFAAREGEKYNPKEYPSRVYINPTITSASKKQRELQEGCLSLRGFWGNVMRAEKVTLEYLDENGAKQKHGASGLLAHIFQHEVDHLNGILYIDKAVEVWEGEEPPGVDA